MSTTKLARWKGEVQSQFREGPPNGWQLGWDENRLFAEICHEVAPHECFNDTSFDYSFCNRYEARLVDRPGRFWTLTIRLSFIQDVFSLHWTEYEDEGRSGRVIDQAPDEEGLRLEKSVRALLEYHGIEELPGEYHDEVVDGVALELSEDTPVTLGKCLFEDYEG